MIDSHIANLRERESSPGYFSDYVGIAQIVIPSAVQTRMASAGASYVKGAIFCSCPEMGFMGDNLLYCRYGLSVPYYRVKVGDKLWIHPTIGDTERWIYTGFVDCGNTGIDPSVTDTQGIIKTEAGIFTITVGTAIIKLDTVAGKVTINGTNFEVLI